MPFMPTDKPPYIAYSAHCARSTEGMSTPELLAHYGEAIRLENLYLASIPEWKMAIAMLTPPLMIFLGLFVIWLVCVYFFPAMIA